MRHLAGSVAPDNSLSLPQDVWRTVFRQLAATLEPHDGLRGPGVVVADIVRAGLTCRDMYHGSREGLEALSEAVPVVVGAEPLPPGDPTGAVDWALWDRLLRRTAECTDAELRDGLRALALPFPLPVAPSACPRPQLAAALLKHFGLSGPCPVPARLWVAVQQERRYMGAGRLSVRVAAALRDMIEGGVEVAKNALAQPNLADARRDLCDMYGGTAGLLAAHRACLRQLAEQRQRAVEEKRLRREARAAGVEAAAARARATFVVGEGSGPRSAAQRRAAVAEDLAARRAAWLSQGCAACVCGNPSAVHCSLVLCGRCCGAYRTDFCARHCG